MKDEALRLALEALGHFEKAGLATLKTIDAITAIKQALEQPAPYRAVKTYHDGKPVYVQEPEPVIDKSAAIRIATSLGWTPKRKPLKVDKDGWYWLSKNECIHVDLIRKVEAAHGIKGEA